jgi:hypothetical protein
VRRVGEEKSEVGLHAKWSKPRRPSGIGRRPRRAPRVRRRAGAQAADAGERQAEPRGERFDVAASRRRGGKGQLVVVAAGEQALLRQHRIGAGLERGARQQGEVDVRRQGGTLEDVADVGEQAVGNVDRRRRQAAQGEPERDARLRTVQRGEAGRHRRPAQTDFSLTVGQPECRQAGRAGHPQVVAVPPAGAGQRLPLRHFAEHGGRQVERAARGVAADDVHPECVGAGEQAAREGGDPVLVGGRQRGGDHRPARLRAHGGKVGKIDGERLPAERLGLGIRQEVGAGRQHVGGDHQVHAGRRAHDGAVVAHAQHRVAHGPGEVARDQREFGRQAASAGGLTSSRRAPRRALPVRPGRARSRPARRPFRPSCRTR